MKYGTVVWDFNGTLLDDVEVGIRSVNKLLSDRGLPVIECRNRYFDVFGFPIREYYERLGFDFQSESYDELAVQWVEQYNHNVMSAPLCHGVRETLDMLRDADVRQYVLSMTESSMLRMQLRQLGVEGYFSDVVGLEDYLAESKLAIASAFARREDLSDAVLIGDTVHDFEASVAMGTDCILVASGHQRREQLERCGCPVVGTVLEIDWGI